MIIMNIVKQHTLNSAVTYKLYSTYSSTLDFNDIHLLKPKSEVLNPKGLIPRLQVKDLSRV